MLLADSICAQPGIHGIVPPRDGGHLSRSAAGARFRPTIRSGRRSTAGSTCSTVSRRDPQPAGAGGPLNAAVRKVPPDLEGISSATATGWSFRSSI